MDSISQVQGLFCKRILLFFFCYLKDFLDHGIEIWIFYFYLNRLILRYFFRSLNFKSSISILTLIDCCMFNYYFYPKAVWFIFKLFLNFNIRFLLICVSTHEKKRFSLLRVTEYYFYPKVSDSYSSNFISTSAF